tara:strand:+ start:1165 stop:1956 length:792 start_codon:yes stop_codon:yes gene_type:complete
MKKSYLQYYEKYSRRAIWRFRLDSLFAHSPTHRDGLTNRCNDYRSIKNNDQLRKLHFNLNSVLLDQANHWTSHDYGEGYFYQGLDEICVTGLRDTSARISALNIPELIRGRTVLDIGSNTGFLSIKLAKTATSVVGIESNPYLNKIGTLTASYLKIMNVEFNDQSFEDFKPSYSYGVVASFANHSTFDGNTRHTIEEYIAKCHSLIENGGLFLFESHAPAYEGTRLTNVLNLIQDQFNILETAILFTGRRFDDGRTLLVASPK